MAGFRVRRRGDSRGLEAPDADVAKRAGSTLVAADERIRLATDELGFAEAELGTDATEGLRQALLAARTLLGEAFRLNRTNHDPFRGAPEEVLDRNTRIVALCERAEHVLDEQLSKLADGIALARRTPEVIAGVLADTERLRSRLPQAREIIDQLAVRYGPATLALVESKPAQAEQLLGFAEHSVRVAERRRDAGHREQSNVALEASVDSVRRAAALLDAVETFEVDALRAESELATIVEESRRNLALALDEPRLRTVDEAIAELRVALAEIPPVGVITDPFVHATRLREANATLDAAIASIRERPTHPVPLRGHLHQAVNRADRQLDVARDVIAGHPGWIGPEALTRLAQSERLRIELGYFLGGSTTTVTAIDADHRAQAIAMASSVLDLASDALRLARLDIEASRRGVRPAVVVR